ncbi:helix-turn-helix domain-containing protein [Aquabacterium sp. J223]|nr:helix-turn-helix domain-containing protein [Aquabacterium sp. J223]UUX94576.1 helix-turn-helix domain-containing protein [Aquabacterium sp. J223]
MAASPHDLPDVSDVPECDEAQLRLARVQFGTSPPPGTVAEELQPWSGDRGFVMAFARGLSVLHAFREQRRPLTIAQVSHRTHLHRAAVRRLLHTLQVLGYVQQDGVQYRLAPRVLTFAHGYLSSTQLTHIARPLVARLSQALQGFCMLVLPDGDVSTVACTSNFPVSRTPDEQPPNLGHREPLHASAAGLVFLAGQDDAAVAGYCAREALRPPLPADVGPARRPGAARAAGARAGPCRRRPPAAAGAAAGGRAGAGRRRPAGGRAGDRHRSRAPWRGRDRGRTAAAAAQHRPRAGRPAAGRGHAPALIPLPPF